MWSRRSILLAVALAGCHRDPPRPVLPAESPAERARAIALRDPAGSSPLDVQLRAAEGRARGEGSAPAWVALGELWVRKARTSSDPTFYAMADAAAALAEQADPGSAGAGSLRALALLNQHRFAEARDLLRKQLASRPDDALAQGLLSDALLELGDYDGATAAAQRMLDLKPSSPAYARGAYLMWLRGDLAGAKESWRLAINAANDPRDPEPRAWALVQAALLFLGQGDVAGAEAGCQAALASVPDYPPARACLGQVALARGDGKAAASELERSYAASPLAATLWLLADARALAGDAAGARRAEAELLRDARRGDPRTLAQFLGAKNREPALALELARTEHGQRQDIFTDDALAWALYRSGDLSGARELSDRALRLGTPDARLWFHSGAIRLAQGDATGRARIEKALALNPAFDVAGAAEARKLLQADSR